MVIIRFRTFAEESHALNRAAFLDHLTGIPNRHGLDVVFETYDSPESLAHVACYMVTITNLKEINQTMGHVVGDQMLKASPVFWKALVMLSVWWAVTEATNS